ncbi:MAG: ABC transporter ATP-binding protein [Sorangiineae bacterium NIC37A_2]|jgi:lipoprotein-releasing system ATP-binding protein|nr:MAG: ABC transporter ATP-binding protein [Sorangiineae bacterium NIC37A_2]
MPEVEDTSPPLLELRDLRKSYGDKIKTEVLHGINLSFGSGEFTAIIGPSGSGKSTLLNQIGLLDRPTSGSVLVQGKKTEDLSEEELTTLRGRTLGFIFQFHHLISALTVTENVLMPLWLSGLRDREVAEKAAKEALAHVGLEEKAHVRADELSGGQQQRVAIARALIHHPAIILADEPTGNLDSKTADSVFSLMRRFNAELGTTFLIVTHDPRMAERCDRVIRIEDGVVASDSWRPKGG